MIATYGSGISQCRVSAESTVRPSDPQICFTANGHVRLMNDIAGNIHRLAIHLRDFIWLKENAEVMLKIFIELLNGIPKPLL